jgi:hypothetical protein
VFSRALAFILSAALFCPPSLVDAACNGFCPVRRTAAAAASVVRNVGSRVANVVRADNFQANGGCTGGYTTVTRYVRYVPQAAVSYSSTGGYSAVYRSQNPYNIELGPGETLVAGSVREVTTEAPAKTAPEVGDNAGCPCCEKCTCPDCPCRQAGLTFAPQVTDSQVLAFAPAVAEEDSLQFSPGYSFPIAMTW